MKNASFLCTASTFVVFLRRLIVRFFVFLFYTIVGTHTRIIIRQKYKIRYCARFRRVRESFASNFNPPLPPPFPPLPSPPVCFSFFFLPLFLDGGCCGVPTRVEGPPSMADVYGELKRLWKELCRDTGVIFNFLLGHNGDTLFAGAFVVIVYWYVFYSQFFCYVR